MDKEIVTFSFPNNWIEDVKLSYNFSTAIYKNKRFVEQRRSLRNLVLRKQSFRVTKEAVEKDLLLNKLMYAKDKRIALPLYPEICKTTTTNLLGKTALTIVEDLSNYWNLYNLCSFILLIETYDKYELIQKNFVTVDTIMLENAITIDFDTDLVRIFPVIFATFGEIKPVYITSKIYSMSMTFQEIRTYQHTETEEEAYEDYFKYNYSKNNPSNSIIDDPDVTTNGGITITPPPNIPPIITIITVTSKDEYGMILRTVDVEIDVNGQVIITKVGDEKYIQISYPHTNMESYDIEVPVEQWFVDTNALSTFQFLEQKNDGMVVDFDTTPDIIVETSTMDVELWDYNFNAKMGRMIRSAYYLSYGRRCPQKWTIDAYRNAGLLPEDFYASDELMGYSSKLGYVDSSHYPGSGTYPPPGQENYSGTNVQFLATEYKVGGTQRTTLEKPSQYLKYVQSGNTLAQLAPNLALATVYNATQLKVYSNDLKNQGIFPESWVGYFYWGLPWTNQNTSLYKFRKETGGYCSLAGTWVDEDCGGVLFPRSTAAWGCKSTYSTDDRVLAIIIVAVHGGVEFWSSRSVCHYSGLQTVMIHDSHP